MFDKLFNKLFGNMINQKAYDMTLDAFIKHHNAKAYHSGRTSSTAGGADWRYGLSSSGASRTIDHRRTRHAARNAYQETPQAKAIVDRFADTVADVGLKLSSTPKASLLGLTPEQVEEWTKDVDSRFDLWARSKKQHRSENMTWYQSHRLYQIGQQRDNDLFVRLYYSNDRSLLNPLQWEFIDADQIRGDAYTNTAHPSVSYDGIIRDKRGREKAYEIFVQDPSAQKFDMVTIPRIGPKSGRVFMLHGFMPDYVGQGRGFSRLGHAIQKLQNLTDFDAAHIKKAIMQSMITMFVKPSKDAPATDFLEGIGTNRGIGAANNTFAQNTTTDTDTSELTDPVTCHDLPEATFETPGSAVVMNLNKGEDLKAFEPKAPVSEYHTFVDSFFSYLSAATSMPVELALMRFNNNYSASRATLILAWRIVQVFREEMAADNLDPTYHMWLAGEIASGRISAPGWQDPTLRAAWLCSKWVASPMPNIDPMRTAQADQLYTLMSAQTLDDVARTFNGSSGAANRAKNTKQFEDLPIPSWAKETSADV